MNLTQAIEHALDGDAVLFVGAGFSLGATNVRRVPIKTGWQLAQHLSAASGLSGVVPLEDAAEEFAQQHGDDALIRELREEFTASAVSDAHQTIAKVPWRRVFTTNYDNVVEASFAAVSRPVVSVTLSDDMRAVSTRDMLCVHLNGSVGHLNRQSLWSEIKLTDRSYSAGTIVDSNWITLFRQDIRLARVVLFVGYSLADLDIKRVLFETGDLREKCFFVLGPTPDAATQRRAGRYGTPLLISGDDCAREIANASSTHVARTPVERIGFGIRRLAQPTGVGASTDALVFNLLLRGDSRDDLIWSSIHGGQSYVVERTVGQKVLDQVRAGSRAVVVHSELGNGKTMLLECVKYRALEHGYVVYSTVTKTDTLLDELSELLRAHDKVLLAIDNYADWFDVVEFFSLHASPQSALLLSSRTSVHDLLTDRLSDALGSATFQEVAVDQMSDVDLRSFSDYLDLYGLWTDRAGWSTERKIDFLHRDCRREVHALLLRLFEAPQILARYQALFGVLDKRQAYHEAVISILALAVLNQSSSTDMLVDLWGDRVLESGFRKDSVVRDLVDFDRGVARMRSATAAEFILRRVSSADITVDVLSKMTRAAEAASRVSYAHRTLFTDLMKFSNVQRLLPEQQRRSAIVRYYEDIKNVPGCKQNPQFWLQYAIACLVGEEFERAGSYFETAYALAERRSGYDTRQIDNHYARFLLAKAEHVSDANECMAMFRKARNIVNDQVKRERLHYPYRVARSYSSFYDHMENRLTSDQRAEVVRAAAFIKDRIVALPEDRRRQKYVSECLENMEYIIERQAERDATSASKGA